MPTMDEYLTRPLQAILAADDPQILTLGASPEALAAWGIGGEIGHPLDPDRWAEDRQYERQDAIRAFRAFGRRRGEVVALLDALSPTQWQRGGIHQARGRMSLGEWVASLADHDDNHLDQLGQVLGHVPGRRTP